MPSADDPANDFEGIKRALFAHIARRGQLDFDARKVPENGFPFPPEPQPPTLWVKFNPDANLMAREYEMQRYVYDRLVLPEGQRIPRAHRVYALPDKTDELSGSGFDPQKLPWGLLVMDYCQGTRLFDIDMHEQDSVFQSIVASRIAELLVVMSSLKPPQGLIAPGPGGDYRMSHLVWGVTDFDAPQNFDTLEDLQDYINTAIKDVKPEAVADFSTEPLCLCYGDFNEGNFFLDDPDDPHSTLTILDFGQTNWLPISFLWWEVVKRECNYGPFYRQVGRVFREMMHGTPEMENVQALNSLRWVCN